jgi:ribosomal protein L37AE/L43A
MILDAIAKKFKQRPWDCPKCNAHFDSYNDLRRHGETVHSITTREQRLAGQLGDLVAHYVDVQTHRVTPNGKGEYLCPECRKPYTDARPLGIHRSVAHGFVGLVQMQHIGQPNFKSQVERDREKKAHVANTANLPAAPKRRGSYKKRSTELAAPTQHVELPAPTQAILAELEPHDCDATQVLAGVQRSLATLNLLIAMQRMSPEQMTALAGTIGAIGNMPQGRK